MGTTKNPIHGKASNSKKVVPARSPGTLGRNDAGDPDAGMCLAGDTPGSVGAGGDGGAALMSQESLMCEALVPVAVVDWAKVRRFVFTVALAEETDRTAARGFASAELQLGDQSKIEAAARSAADKLLEEYQRAAEAGPAAVTEFNAALDARKARAKASLDTKFAEAQKAGCNWVSFLGGTVKVLAVVKFASTVTVKTVSIFTGVAGTGIDWAYSTALEVNKQVQEPDTKKTVSGVIIDETGDAAVSEMKEMLNELVADKLMTPAEQNKFNGLIGNYKGNAAKLEKQLAELEEKIRKSTGVGKEGTKKSKLVARRVEKLAKFKALRKKTLAAFLKKGTRMGAAKKLGGKAATLVFLADDVKEAWNDLAKEWEDSN